MDQRTPLRTGDLLLLHEGGLLRQLAQAQGHDDGLRLTLALTVLVRISEGQRILQHVLAGQAGDGGFQRGGGTGVVHALPKNPQLIPSIAGKRGIQPFFQTVDNFVFIHSLWMKIPPNLDFTKVCGLWKACGQMWIVLC